MFRPCHLPSFTAKKQFGSRPGRIQSDGRQPQMKRVFRTKTLRWAAGVVALLAVAWIAVQVMPPRGTVPGQNPFRAREDGRPLVIAHGGGLGLQPENTLEAFTASAALGCDVLEMDVRLTKDGVLVTHHDATVERTSNGKGAVIDQTLAELKALNFGYRFRDPSGAHVFRERPAHLATVEELFERFGRFPMNIELKDRGEVGRRAGATLAALIAKHRMANQVLVASFDDATLDAFRQATGRGVATSTAKGQTRQFVLLNLLRLDRLWPGGAMAAQVPSNRRESAGFNLTRAGFIRAMHARNMAVHYWTVNDPDEMRRLIRLGADGLITDYPDRLRAMIEERGN
jgi:glycerophosphoryl diester phosphodiesterase